jgi:hypothetical protein
VTATPIDMFWHGPALSRVEQLAMSSFLAHGHPVHLHVYREPGGVPRGVELIDAGATLPETELFVHERSGSIAAFADWFRYRLLNRQGGLWADTDIICLRPWQYATPEIFARQDEHTINNAVLGLSRGHALAAFLARCCEQPNRILPYDSFRTRRRKLVRRLFRGNRRGNIDWGEYGPAGLTAAATHLGYADRALPAWHFYPITYRNWRTIFEPSTAATNAALERSCGLHVWNEMTRQAPGFDKNAHFAPDSLFEQLCMRHEVA